MTMRTRLAATILAALALLVAGCGGGDENDGGGSGAATTATPTGTATPAATDADAGEEAGAKDKDCDKIGHLAGKPKHRLPRDVPLVAGARVYQSEGPFGKTVRYFAAASGGPEDLPKARDAVAARLAKAGYKVLSKDQEEGAEAEAHLSGKHTVDVQVINLCEGKLRIRYTVS